MSSRSPQTIANAIAAGADRRAEPCDTCAASPSDQ